MGLRTEQWSEVKYGDREQGQAIYKTKENRWE